MQKLFSSSLKIFFFSNHWTAEGSTKTPFHSHSLTHLFSLFLNLLHTRNFFFLYSGEILSSFFLPVFSSLLLCECTILGVTEKKKKVKNYEKKVRFVIKFNNFSPSYMWWVHSSASRLICFFFSQIANVCWCSLFVLEFYRCGFSIFIWRRVFFVLIILIDSENSEHIK